MNESIMILLVVNVARPGRARHFFNYFRAGPGRASLIFLPGRAGPGHECIYCRAGPGREILGY